MQARPLSRRRMVDLLARHQITPRKHLGQHFLVDPNVTERIVRQIEAPPGTNALEIGAGTGTLTVALRDAGYPVLAYEIDRGLEPALREVIGDRDQIELRFADAARVDFDLSGRWVLAANLPYHAGTGMLLDVLRECGVVEEAVVMVQKEVADRLAAAPGSRTYGLPSVVAQLFADVKPAFTVPPQVFLPPPRVGSAVLHLRRTAPPSALYDRAVELAAAAFGHRRKMLRSSLASVLPDPERIATAAGIDLSLRAEDLSPGDYLALARAEGDGDD